RPYIYRLIERLKSSASRAFVALIQLAVREAGKLIGNSGRGRKLKVPVGCGSGQGSRGGQGTEGLQGGSAGQPKATAGGQHLFPRLTPPRREHLPPPLSQPASRSPKGPLGFPCPKLPILNYPQLPTTC